MAINSKEQLREWLMEVARQDPGDVRRLVTAFEAGIFSSNQQPPKLPRSAAPANEYAVSEIEALTVTLNRYRPPQRRRKYPPE